MGPLVARSRRVDRECVDPFAHEVAERGVNHALSLHAAFSGEFGAFDAKREVAFSLGIIALVAEVPFAFVDEL